MRLPLIALAIVLFGNLCAAAEKNISVLRDLKLGYAAFGQPSIMDELQIIGEPRELSQADLKALAELLSAEDTWYERQADGTLKGMKAMCMVRWDFKFIFELKNGEIAVMRLCSGCRQVQILIDQEILRVPDMRTPAMESLGKLFDKWFPSWAEITAKGRQEWHRRHREHDSDQRPNKAPEPTPTSVTSPAAQEPRQP